MPRYLADQIDPATLHLVVDQPFLDHLEELTQRAVAIAQFQQLVVLIHHQTVEEEGTIKEKLVYRTYAPEMFAKGLVRFPRDADALWEQQNQRPRYFPSILVAPTQPMWSAPEVVVSKPSLCEGCQHYLHRQTTGDCHGLAYQALEFPAP